MPVGALGQIKLLNNEIKPPGATLYDLVVQTSVMYAVEFYNTHKVFNAFDNSDPNNPVPINVEANAYLTAMLKVSNFAIVNNKDVMLNLTRTIATLIGNALPNLGALIALHETNGGQWETFVFDQMKKSFEYVGRITRQQKTAYAAI